MDAIGLGYNDLNQANPRLIYRSLKGFLSGPYQHRAALDEVVQMMGLAHMTGLPGRPLRAGAPVNDMMGGMFCRRCHPGGAPPARDNRRWAIRQTLIVREQRWLNSKCSFGLTYNSPES